MRAMLHALCEYSTSGENEWNSSSSYTVTATYDEGTFDGTYTQTLQWSWWKVECGGTYCQTTSDSGGGSGSGETTQRIDPYSWWSYYGWYAAYGGHPALGIFAIELGNHLAASSLHIDLGATLATPDIRLDGHRTPGTMATARTYPDRKTGKGDGSRFLDLKAGAG